MEHIPSGIENIKVSLMRVSDYIINKSVDRGKVNDFDDLKGVSKVAWDLIFAIYEAGWDVLHVKDNISFRNNVMSKFTPKINDMLKTKNGKNIEKPVLISSLLPHIPAKSPKEVNNLNRFFKKKTIVPNRKEQGSKSYTQASSIENVARETLKIKEIFPKLQASKIKNIQKNYP